MVGMKFWIEYKRISKSEYKTGHRTTLTTANQLQENNIYSLVILNWKGSSLETPGKVESRGKTKDLKQGQYIKDYS